MDRLTPKTIGECIENWMQEDPSLHGQLLQIEAEQRASEFLRPYGKYLQRLFVKDETLFLRISAGEVRLHIDLDKAAFINRINAAIGLRVIDRIVFI